MGSPDVTVVQVLTAGRGEWWQDHDNIVLLTRHMADTGETADTVADAVAKPWKFEDEFVIAWATL
jgi:hypothetical protein